MAGFTNMAAAARERKRRELRAIEDPFYPVVSQSPEWDGFFGALHDQADAANEAGLNYRVDLSGLGRDGSDGSLGGGLNYFDRESLKNQAINAQADVANQQHVKDAEARRSQEEQRQNGLRNDLWTSYIQQQLAGQNAPLIEPTTITRKQGTQEDAGPYSGKFGTSRPTVGAGESYTMRPTGDATAQMLARMDPIKRLAAQRDIDAQKLAQQKQTESEKATQAEIDLKKRALDETIRKNQFEEGGQDVAGNVKTTLSGKTYLDLGDYQTPTAKEAARRRAQALGIKAVPPDVGASLAAADTAKQNIDAMWAQIESKLPKDPLGRVVAGPANKLSKFFQTDEDLAAFNSWRAGAIQAVQALVEKGMGFRLNQAEINMIMENDMPQITDTVETARRRVNNVRTLLKNKENTALTQDRSALAGGASGTGRGGGPGPSTQGTTQIGKYQVEIH